jgi:ribonucleoside-diphosphate reductase alpha chain
MPSVMYDYISRLWFMPSTPILSNGGTSRGLPISCFLNETGDALEDIVNLWNENVWLASLGRRHRFLLGQCPLDRRKSGP